jgi:hypothetical protein
VAALRSAARATAASCSVCTALADGVEKRSAVQESNGCFRVYNNAMWVCKADQHTPMASPDQVCAIPDCLEARHSAFVASSVELVEGRPVTWVFALLACLGQISCGLKMDGNMDVTDCAIQFASIEMQWNERLHACLSGWCCQSCLQIDTSAIQQRKNTKRDT